MKSRGEIMEILEAFDLTRSFRDAGELAGCSHHTVAQWVALVGAGPGAGQNSAMGLFASGIRHGDLDTGAAKLRRKGPCRGVSGGPSGQERGNKPVMTAKRYQAIRRRLSRRLRLRPV